MKGRILPKVREPINGVGWNETQVSPPRPLGPHLRNSEEGVKAWERQREEIHNDTRN